MLKGSDERTKPAVITTYYSVSNKNIYNNSKNYCPITVWQKTIYPNQTFEVKEHSCKSDYCNIDGLSNRRKKARKLIDLHNIFTFHYHKTVNWKKLDTENQKTSFYREYCRLLRLLSPAIRITKINHWKRKLQHWHIIVSSDNPLFRNQFRNIFVKALNSAGINNTSAYKHGHQESIRANEFIWYAMKCRKCDERLRDDEFPPPEIDWRMVTIRN